MLAIVGFLAVLGFIYDVAQNNRSGGPDSGTVARSFLYLGVMNFLGRGIGPLIGLGVFALLAFGVIDMQFGQIFASGALLFQLLLSAGAYCAWAALIVFFPVSQAILGAGSIIVSLLDGTWTSATVGTYVLGLIWPDLGEVVQIVSDVGSSLIAAWIALARVQAA